MHLVMFEPDMAPTDRSRQLAGWQSAIARVKTPN